MDTQLIITIAIIVCAVVFGGTVMLKGLKAFSPKSCGDSCGCNTDAK